jgi:hypothetical protein
LKQRRWLKLPEEWKLYRDNNNERVEMFDVMRKIMKHSSCHHKTTNLLQPIDICVISKLCMSSKWQSLEFFYISYPWDLLQPSCFASTLLRVIFLGVIKFVNKTISKKMKILQHFIDQLFVLSSLEPVAVPPLFI